MYINGNDILSIKSFGFFIFHQIGSFALVLFLSTHSEAPTKLNLNSQKQKKVSESDEDLEDVDVLDVVEAKMTECCFIQCSMRSEDAQMFPFPQDEERRRSWVKMLRPDEPAWTPDEDAKVCEHHFTESMFVDDISGDNEIRVLKQSAYPMLFRNSASFDMKKDPETRRRESPSKNPKDHQSKTPKGKAQFKDNGRGHDHNYSAKINPILLTPTELPKPRALQGSLDRVIKEAKEARCNGTQAMLDKENNTANEKDWKMLYLKEKTQSSKYKVQYLREKGEKKRLEEELRRERALNKTWKSLHKKEQAKGNKWRQQYILSKQEHNQKGEKQKVVKPLSEAVHFSQLRKFLNVDQINLVLKPRSTGFSWSEETLKVALQLKEKFGPGYKMLLSMNYPLPSIKTLQRYAKKLKKVSSETYEDKTVGKDTRDPPSNLNNSDRLGQISNSSPLRNQNQSDELNNTTILNDFNYLSIPKQFSNVANLNVIKVPFVVNQKNSTIENHFTTDQTEFSRLHSESGNESVVVLVENQSEYVLEQREEDSMEDEYVNG